MTSAARGRRTAALSFAIGSGLYALGVTFDLTPVWYGAVALGAGVASRQPRLVAIACPLVGWGVAVLAVRHGPVLRPREAAADLVGVGLGMLVASIWARHRELSTIGPSLTVISGGVAFFLAFDLPALGRWPVWCALMLAWGAFEAVARAGRIPGSRRSADGRRKTSGSRSSDECTV